MPVSTTTSAMAAARCCGPSPATAVCFARTAPSLVRPCRLRNPVAGIRRADESIHERPDCRLHRCVVAGERARDQFRHASDDAYWLSAEDLKNLGYRSPAYDRYLRDKCAWDDQIEREVVAGKRPVEDLKRMLTCRDRVTQGAARQALALAATIR